MKSQKRFILWIIMVLVVWSAFFLTDRWRASADEAPIFAVATARYDDGGSVQYVGLFYTVYHVRGLGEAGNEDYGYHLVAWFVSLDDVKESLIA